MVYIVNRIYNHLGDKSLGTAVIFYIRFIEVKRPTLNVGSAVLWGWVAEYTKKSKIVEHKHSSWLPLDRDGMWAAVPRPCYLGFSAMIDSVHKLGVKSSFLICFSILLKQEDKRQSIMQHLTASNIKYLK